MTKSTIRSLCLSTVFAGLTVAAAAQKIEVNQNNRTIAVTVSDKASAEADVATVHIGFEAYGPDSDSAYAAGSQTSNAIIDALHKAGIDDKAIQSEGQNLRQNFQFDDKESEIDRAKKRYILTQSWTVKTPAADAAKVLNVAVQAGANASGQIDWDVKDRVALQAQAAAKALQHAQAIADQMAKGLNVHLGALIYASNQPPQTINPLGGVAGGMMMRAQEAKAIPLAIRPQQIEENATVYAVFAIE
jgi:uncharacterized protein